MTNGQSKERCLIIGASGQVGWQIYSMLGADRAVGTSRESGSSQWVAADLASLAQEPKLAEELVTHANVTAIYCVGGMTDAERCETESDLAMRVNCYGPGALAAAAAKRHIPFVYFSTEYVFNGKSGPYAEDAPAAPINAYGRSKWMGEQAVRSAHAKALIIRTTVVYGPDPRCRNFLYSLRRAVASGRAVRVACDQISTPTYNRDLASATIALMQAGAEGVFHVCGPQRLSRFEFAVLAARAIGLDTSRIVGVPTSELHQLAPRPFQAGLLNTKLEQYPLAPPMQPAERSIREWVAETGFNW